MLTGNMVEKVETDNNSEIVPAPSILILHISRSATKAKLQNSFHIQSYGGLSDH